MKINDVKKLVNLKELGRAVEENELDGFFEEEIEILISELNEDVYKLLRKNDISEDVIDYLDKLKKQIRKDIITTIRLYQYSYKEVQ